MMSLIKTLMRPVAALLSLSMLCASAGADTIVVNQFNFTFSPQDITINEGDTVRWVWNGGTHDTVEGDDGVINGNEAWNGTLTSQVQSYEQTFDAAFLASFPRTNNVYDYFCSPHFIQFNMVGTIRVESEPGASFCDCSAVTACNNSDTAGAGCRNSSGSGAILTASGSTSVAADDIAFEGILMPSNKPALLFVGTTALNGGSGAVFGDGVRCAGGQLTRLAVKFTDAGGSASWGAGQNATGIWNAGTTRYFQVWYRDPQNGPCGTGFNVSNGYEVSFN